MKVTFCVRGVLSPLLANFYLDEFDRRLRSAGVKFVRYADDFLVVARTPFDLAAARDLVVAALADLRLALNLEKTQTTTFDQWFRFLGAELQGDAILLPFEKAKTPLEPVCVSPAMPPALLRAWREGHLTPRADFDRDRYKAPPPAPLPTAKPGATRPMTSVLRALAGGPPPASPGRSR